MSKMTLGGAVRAAREKWGFTLRDIELLSEGEITNSYVHQIEIGKAMEPHPRKLKILAKVLKLELVELYRLAGYMPEKAGAR